MQPSRREFMAPDRRSEILKTLHLISSPGSIVEVRIITNDGIGSGYFDTFEKLADQSVSCDNPQIRGIYITLNEVNPHCLHGVRTGSSCGSQKRMHNRRQGYHQTALAPH
jgi:hypothetical protein